MIKRKTLETQMKWIIAVFVLTLSLVANADTLEKARLAKAKIKTLIPENYNASIGITKCDPKTGKQTQKKNSVYCVIVGAQSEEDAEELLKSYPAKTKIEDTFITINNMGKIEPLPRVGGGG